MDLQEFIAEVKKVKHFLAKGRLNDGCAYAVAACYHPPSGDDEKPWLRDLRIDFLSELLGKLEGYHKPCVKTRYMTNHIQALLDRRAFNRKFGKGLEKGLFPSASAYDPGFDKHLVSLREYVGKLPTGAAPEKRYSEWLLVAACALAQEVNMIQANRTNKFRVGVPVFAHGLIRSPGLNECVGVLTKKQGIRWAVHFVNNSTGLLKESNLEIYGTLSKNKQAVLTQLAAILAKLDGLRLRSDVAARADYAKECVRNRCLQKKTKCCSCCINDGLVDFYALYHSHMDHMTPNQQAAERTLRFKEFFLSGLCQACQQSVFN